MKSRLFVIISVIFFPITSCIDSKNKKDDSSLGTETFYTVSINQDYKLSIPKFMTGTTGLNEEASLQYQSLLKEAYLLVIDEPKAGFEEVYRDLNQYDDDLSIMQNYRDARIKILSRTTEINRKTKPEFLKINGLDAETMELDANIEGVANEISYFLTFIEGDDRVYMIMAWTLKNKKIEHKKTFKTIAESFELVD
ncbi:hypothetical protein [Flagellimonas lutimaris]|uniref:hypothetical protein n=1 Tax=Flagellimonas lutimaris TaxID=475082 RepID=UPI000B7461F2|nr:MAG: hypothetical protein CBB72_000260 [Muricauda sp. TMED12]|tara:strand:+ start:275341 stop:275928 length:588 start_codon:yes stop_codon:yes gene_type:complete